MSGTGPVGIGIVGAGVISETYLKNLTSFPDVTVHAIGDLLEDSARKRAEQFGIASSGDVASVISHPDVEIVVNLTIPTAHVPVALKAVAAGKHVLSEKPFSLDRQSGELLLAAAADAGVRVGCAPDTFLGAGLQAAFRAIQDGRIGTPLTALTLMQSPGPESWHPNPAFLFQEGAGPLFDIGPYYLTALVQTFGSIARVAASGSTAHPRRTIGSGPKAGEQFDVTVPSHVGALLEFAAGGSGQSIWSFDSALSRHGFVEIAGTEGTLVLPDPNFFDGDVLIHRRGSDGAEVLTSTVATSTRGTGVLELARAIREDRPHRASGELAFHVVDAMVSIAESVDTGEFVRVESSAPTTPPLPADWDPLARTV
ncbi:Gfo/Idh/MocA family protein [Mycetocola miduiensis]|uniref:Predicted dehydrogenase n=1 Tax=Mycetocola miduiensis TaxID=995034 RepID=A0A1I4YMJ9_9MICO|nr:Gfo/Idh/MocA family oxidoreductase [Mycetocola miduiensis]SFN39251.1 Predicted dehydrogenase [Mycetocola miduiensis]